MVGQERCVLDMEFRARLQVERGVWSSLRNKKLAVAATMWYGTTREKTRNEKPNFSRRYQEIMRVWAKRIPGNEVGNDDEVCYRHITVR